MSQAIRNFQDSVKASQIKDHFQRALLLFFSYPQKYFSTSDVVEMIGISKSTAQDLLPDLIDRGFLVREVIGRVHRHRCNKDHVFNISRKPGYWLQSIFESGLMEHLKQDYPQARSITLFGSYTTGQDNETSDMDIAIEVLDGQGLRMREYAVFKSLGYRQNVPVNVHVFTRSHIDLNLFNSIVNGIVLDGFLEAQK